jgi:hypothetical protein
MMPRTRTKDELRLYTIKKLLEEQYNLKLSWNGKMKRWTLEGLEK